MNAHLRSLLSAAAAICAGGLVAGLLAVGAFGLDATFHGPGSDQKLALRVLAKVSHLRTMRSLETLSDGSRVRVLCSSRQLRDVLHLSPGARLVVRNGRLHGLGPPSPRSTRLVAEAVLAGCPHLLSVELVSRLLAGKPMLGGERLLQGVPVFAIRLGASEPRLALYVSRRGLRPLGMSLVGRRVRGHSVLRVERRRRRHVQPPAGVL